MWIFTIFFQDVSQTFGLDKTDTVDVPTKPSDLALDTAEQSAEKSEFVEDEEKQSVPGILTDNADLRFNNEPEVVLNQYVTESNAVSVLV